jgi:hypothetical protein
LNLLDYIGYVAGGTTQNQSFLMFDMANIAGRPAQTPPFLPRRLPPGSPNPQ